MLDTVRDHTSPYTLARGEAAGLRYLERSDRAGGVLTSSYVGQAVPARTGRAVLIGDPSNAGGAGADTLRSLAARPGLDFVLTDCRSRGDLAPALRPLGFTARRFGCATLYGRR
jgi:hypothetical protein